jgi:ribosomal-protein-alanine N-acetyltransferase
MKFHIETERLILRELQMSDLKDWFEMDSDPEVHKYLGNQPVKNMAQIENAFHSIQQQYIDNGIGRWATIEKSSGNFIGWSGLKFINEKGNNHIKFYDVGYRLNPKFWGKGYATESCKASLEFGFNILNLHEIIGIANEKNKASRRVLEKCGLKFVEKYMWEDIQCDWLKITKNEWQLFIKQENIRLYRTD